MNKPKHFLILIGILFFIVPKFFSQNKDNWEPVYLLVTGANTMDGVEACFKLAKCNNEDVVYIKFNNHNEYSVKLEWFDAVFTQELRWINKDGEGNKKTLIIPSKMEARGGCESNNTELVVKLKDFIVDKNNFKRFHTSQLTIVSAQ